MVKKVKTKATPNHVFHKRLNVWADALESGDYKQGKGSLKTTKGRFCCLGVACDISKLGKWGEDSEVGIDYIAKGYWNAGVLTHPIKTYFGLPDSAGFNVVDKEGLARDLAELNDGGVKFTTITKHIRKFADETYPPSSTRRRAKA